jgi:hypothetical protein
MEAVVMTDAVVATPPSPPATRRALAAVGLLALVGSGLVGANVGRTRERLWGSESPTARPAAASRTVGDGTSETTVETGQSVLHSQPWWQSVGKLEGTGSATTQPFTVGPGAIQWRVTATCSSGHLLVRAPNQARPVIDANCSGTPTGYGVAKGQVSLQVTADGPWQLVVDQQVDVPLNEPPLPAMTAPGTAVVGSGSLYRIDQVGTGAVTLYRLNDARYALRFDNFFITANSDLEVQLSPLDAPHSTDQVVKSGPVTVAPLDVTTGSLNFVLPANVDPTQYKSVVIWCDRLYSAYAAAILKP